MHEHYLYDDEGDLTDVVPFCCDACHREWCGAQGEEYDGWNGCHEGADYPQWCANCGARCGIGIETDCDGDCVPVGVYPPYDRKCEHGYAYYLPAEVAAYVLRGVGDLPDGGADIIDRARANGWRDVAEHDDN